MMNIFLVKIRYLFYLLNKRNKRQTEEDALFNSKLISYFCLVIFFLNFFLILDLIFQTTIISLIYNLIPFQGFVSRRLFVGGFVLLIIVIVHFIKIKVLKISQSSKEKEFFKYVSKKKTLVTKEKILLGVLLSYLIFGPLIIIGISTFFK